MRIQWMDIFVHVPLNFITSKHPQMANECHITTFVQKLVAHEILQAHRHHRFHDGSSNYYSNQTFWSYGIVVTFGIT